jgi:type IV secretion system protein VirB6
MTEVVVWKKLRFFHTTLTTTVKACTLRFMIKHVLLLLSLLFLSGCTEPTDEGQSVYTKAIQLDTKNSDWIDAGSFNKDYKYVIKVQAKTLGFREHLPIGSARFCPDSSNHECNAINGKLTSNSPVSPYGDVGKVAVCISSSPSSCASAFVVDQALCDIGNAPAEINSTCSSGTQIGMKKTLENTQLENGRILLKVLDTDYTDNKGVYEVFVETYGPDDTNVLGSVTEYVLHPLLGYTNAKGDFQKGEIGKVAEMFWSNLIKGGGNIIRIMLVLYIAILGVYVVMGGVELTHKDLISRAIKIGIICTLLSPGSINFFNNYFLDLFTKGQTELINYVVRDVGALPTQGSNPDFNSMFKFTSVIATLFSAKMLKLLFSFLLWFPFGIILCLMLVVTMVEYLIAVVEAIIAYLIAATAIQFLIALGPIFISLLLFEKTKDYCKKWVLALVSFTAQPAILWAVILVVSNLIFSFLYSLMSINIEWVPIISIYFQPFELWSRLDLFTIYFYNPVDSVLMIFVNVIAFFMLVRLMKNVTPLGADIASKLFGGTAAKAGAGMAAEVGKAIRNKLENPDKSFDPAQKNKGKGDDGAKGKDRGGAGGVSAKDMGVKAGADGGGAGAGGGKGGGVAGVAAAAGKAKGGG